MRTKIFLAAVAVPGLLMGGTALAQGQAGQDCAIEWTAADADNNGRITAEEATAASDSEFNRYDADSDGVITQAEYANCLGTSASADMQAAAADAGTDDAATGLSDIPQTADADQSGAVTRDEMATAMEEQTGTDMSGQDMEAEARRTGWRFAMTDTNGDGEITQRELNAADQQLQQSFAAADANGDGMLTPEEWNSAEVTWAPVDQDTGQTDQTASTQPSQQQTGQQQTGQSGQGGPLVEKPEFAQIDIDGDQQIDRSEWAVSSLQQMAVQRFRQMDENNDGTLTREEYQTAAADRFGQAGNQPQGLTPFRYYLFVY